MDNFASASSTLEPLFTFLSYSLSTLEYGFFKIPGSQVVARYVKSSHQNDPGRTILEIILVVFVVRSLLQHRTRSDRAGSHFIKLEEKEIDDLVDDWTPEPLMLPLSDWEQKNLASVPVIVGPNGPRPKLSSGKTLTNLASFNFTALAGNETIKQRAIETLRKYGLGSCGPPGFFGTVDVHLDLERDIAEFIGTEGSILYSQGFSTISSVIPAFSKRGDIIVADKAVNFAIQKGIQISRSTVRWYDHNDLKSLEDVLESIERERVKKRLPLTRRFIITEGIFEKDGAMVDLPKLIELKHKYKFRIMLDETISFGTMGRTGRGLTELFNVPASNIDMLIGSVANGLGSSGGFCAGSANVVDHQRINAPSFVFSASMPPLLATAASEAITHLRNNPSVLTTLQENIRVVHSVLDKVEGIQMLGHPASPAVHFNLKTPPEVAPGASAYEVEAQVLQDIVDEAMAQGVLLTRAKQLVSQEMFVMRPTIRIAVSAAFSKKEIEKAAQTVKAAIGKVVPKRK